MRPSGSKELFYRYRVEGADTLLKLGLFDHTGRAGLTLSQARGKLAEARGDQRETGDVKAHRKAQKQQEREAKAKAEQEAKRGTVLDLLRAYAKSLRDAGKVSAGKVEGIFRRNVEKPFPELAAAKADEITPEDIQRILNRMTRKGIKRQVNVTRSYLHAAFRHGLRAHLDPRNDAHADKRFRLKVNPVRDVPRIAAFERSLDRVLSADELRAYWHALESLPLVQRCALRFALALACQRPTQLLRADWSAFDLAEGKETLRLRDAKGRGSERDHVLPIPAAALEQLGELRKVNAKAPSPFSADGKRTISPDTLSHAVRAVSDALANEPHKMARFQLRDLRRTAETMLQQLGIDREVRAHLLSHGRTRGVQGKHYERYDFLPEKRQALERWNAHLSRIIEGKHAEKVVELKRA